MTYSAGWYAVTLVVALLLFGPPMVVAWRYARSWCSVNANAPEAEEPSAGADLALKE